MGRITFRPDLDSVLQRGAIANRDIQLKTSALKIFDGTGSSTVYGFIASMISADERIIRKFAIPNQYLEFYDDFLGATLDTKWNTTLTGGTVTIDSSDSALYSGCVKLGTGAVAGNDARLHMGAQKNFRYSQLLCFAARFKLLSLISNTNFAFGLVNLDYDPSTVPLGTNPHVLIRKGSAQTKFMISSADGTTQTELDSLTNALSTTVYDFYLLKNPTNNSLDVYYTNNWDLASLLINKTTNLPSTQPLMPYFGLDANAAADKQMLIDFCLITMQGKE